VSSYLLRGHDRCPCGLESQDGFAGRLRGVATLEQRSTQRTHSWLDEHHFQRLCLDFTNGISPVVGQLGKLLAWERQFGYVLEPTSRNLAALHDGFEFDVPSGSGLVLEVERFDRALQEDHAWSVGFLAIVSGHSIRQLALARRFFALLHVPDERSEIIGERFDELSIPYPFRFRGEA